jgi:two-component system, OmpR family, sensor kinase
VTAALARARDFSSRMPLRVRLVLLMLGLLAVALIITGIAGPALLQRYLVQRVDAQLAQTAIPASMDCHNHRIDDLDSHGVAQLNGFYRLCFSPAGEPAQAGYLYQTSTAQTAPALPSPLNATTVANRLNQPFRVAGSNGGPDWEVLIAKQNPGGGGPPEPVLVAFSLDETNRIVNQLILLEVIVAAMVLVLVALLAYVLIRSSLRPLVAVEHTAEAIAAGDLTRRVPQTDPRTEVGGLALALNVMLGQIETAFDERRASEEQARSSEEAARSSEARMRRFVTDASHELRTPLTSIRGFAELYRQNGGDNPEVNRIIGRIEHHATRMGVLVDDLLLLARLDQQRPLDRKPVDLLALATDAVIDARVTAPDHVLRLKAGVAGEADGDEGLEAPVVLGDAVRLRQVVGNLIANALTHTPAGTEVTVSVRTDDRFAILEVADNGPGMKAEDAARVFERFYRTDPSRTRAAGGSGLGLSIVAALVQAHGGEVSVSAEEGEGATFTVRLPLQHAPAPAPDPAATPA